MANWIGQMPDVTISRRIFFFSSGPNSRSFQLTKSPHSFLLSQLFKDNTFSFRICLLNEKNENNCFVISVVSKHQQKVFVIQNLGQDLLSLRKILICSQWHVSSHMSMGTKLHTLTCMTTVCSVDQQFPSQILHKLVVEAFLLKEYFLWSFRFCLIPILC